MATDANAPDTIVLIHGLWLTPLSWEKWIDRYKSKGYNVIAPAWPGMEGDIDQVRSNTKPYENLGITEIADHYEQIIRGLDKTPIIMGHSFGGLITQVLLDRGLGAAGVGISPAPIKGILALPFSALKVASVALRNPPAQRGAVERGLRAPGDPWPGARSLPGRRLELHPEFARGRTPEAWQPAAAAAASKRQGPHGARLGDEKRLQDPAEGELADRAEGIPGPVALHVRPGRLGGRGRRRARLGDAARGGARRGLTPT